MGFIILAAVRIAANPYRCMRPNTGERTFQAAIVFSVSARTAGMRFTIRWDLWMTMESLFPLEKMKEADI